jgi:ABC-type multidrug transport system fused ATPase/permease subunit
MKTLYKRKIHRNHVGNITHGGLFIVFTAGYYATLFWGVFQIASGSMDYGTLMAFLQIVSNIRAPFFSASGLITRFYSALASAERLMEIEGLEAEPIDNDFDAEATYNNMDEIRVQNLSFTYGDDDMLSDYRANVTVDGMTIELRVNHPYCIKPGVDLYLSGYDTVNEEFCVLQIVREPWRYGALTGVIMMLTGAFMLFVGGPRRRNNELD